MCIYIYIYIHVLLPSCCVTYGAMPQLIVSSVVCCRTTYPTLSYRGIQFVVHYTLFYPILSYPTLPYPSLPSPILSWNILACPSI